MDFINSSQKWDVIVIGAGVGGATIGYALAKAGKKVLFLEKGLSRRDEKNLLLEDKHAELFFPRVDVARPQYSDILKRSGRWAETLTDQTQKKENEFVPFLGTGDGGSSSIYGMVMSRFFPQDFEPGQNHPKIPNATLQEKWPITYNELRPFYKAVEDLYQVRGEIDPLRGVKILDPLKDAPAVSQANQSLAKFLQAKGMHPYRLPIACKFVENCKDCISVLCSRNCKNDAGQICLNPALNDYGAVILNECEVVQLDSTDKAVTGVKCLYQGKEIVLNANIIILAAGALFSPVLLLKSKSSFWPQGLANTSGLVGKNLMRHNLDLYGVESNIALNPYPFRELSINDFYCQNNMRLGNIHSFSPIPSEIIVADLVEELRLSAIPLLPQLVKVLGPFIQKYLDKNLNQRLILATLTEDLPYRENAVSYDDKMQRIIFQYRMHNYEKERVEQLRIKMKEILKPLKFIHVKQAESNMRLAHACGTCRFGDDANESVLDKNNKAHDLENLYVVDSSFFPSSGATSPSLTIAANALRVAETILKKW